MLCNTLTCKLDSPCPITPPSSSSLSSQATHALFSVMGHQPYPLSSIIPLASRRRMLRSSVTRSAVEKPCALPYKVHLEFGLPGEQPWPRRARVHPFPT